MQKMLCISHTKIFASQRQAKSLVTLAYLLQIEFQVMIRMLQSYNQKYSFENEFYENDMELSKELYDGLSLSS